MCVPVDHNIRKEYHVRVCNDCQTKTRELHRLINAGDANGFTSYYQNNDPSRFHLDCASSFYEAGWFPLHIACKTGSLQIVRWLVEVGSCRVDVLSEKGETPLEIAAISKRFDCVQYLHGRGASLERIRNRMVMLHVLERAMERLRGRRGRNGSGHVGSDDADASPIMDNAGLSESEALNAALAASSDMVRETKTRQADHNGVDIDEEEALSIAIAASASISTNESASENRTSHQTPSAPVVVVASTTTSEAEIQDLPTAHVLDAPLHRRTTTADLTPPSSSRTSSGGIDPPLLPPPPTYEDSRRTLPPPSYESSSTPRAA